MERRGRRIRRVALLKISWHDVLFPHMVPHLSLKDLFSFRCCSQICKIFVDESFMYRKKINLSGCNSANIAAAFKVLSAYCQRLEEINLAKCLWLEDDLLVPLLSNNKRLKVVNLNECTAMTSAGLQPVIIDCKLLRVLKLSKCDWLTSGAVDALTLHHSNLVELDISHCYAIGERCLIIFFRMFDQLEILSLANTPSVTDYVLMQIAHYCPRMKHLNFVGCHQISNLGIDAITTHCKELESLMVQRCPNVTERILGHLRERIHVDKPRQLSNWPMYDARIFLQV